MVARDFITKIVMVSPSCDSSCEKSRVSVQKIESEIKMLGPLCKQTVNLKTDSKTLLQYTESTI